MKNHAALLVMAAVVGLNGCDDGAASGAVAQGPKFAERVVKTCDSTMRSVDCGCFWEESAAAFTAANIEPILQALAERERWGPAITRVRLEKVAGQDNYRKISGALYECVKVR